MTDPFSVDWRNLRTKLLVRNLLPFAIVTAAGAYLIALTMNLSPDQASDPFLIWAPIPVGLVVLLLQFVVAGQLCRSALSSYDREHPGQRLERLLSLPRRLELYCLVPSYVAGGFLFTLFTCMKFGKSLVFVPIGMTVTLVVALLVCIPAVLWFQSDVMPHALKAYERASDLHPQGSGPTWPRQSWYLPYTFVVLMLLMMACWAVVIVSRLSAARDKLLDQMNARGGGELLELARASTDEAIANAIAPIAVITLVVLGFVVVAGWLMGQRERAAAMAIEESLNALVAGNPKLPAWIGTDEVGDLAFTVGDVSIEMQKVFGQLKVMAEGSLSVHLEGESGLVSAFRESQRGLLQLAEHMKVLSRGDTVAEKEVFGDLGASFVELSAAMGETIAQAKTIADGDLRKDPQMTGELGAAIHQMTKNLRSMVGQTQDVGAKIANIVVALRSASLQLSTATTQQVSALAETANTMTELSQTSAASADRCSELIRQGESAALVVDKGRNGASDAGRAMGNISASLAKVAQVSTSLFEKVQQVDGIIETVGFLADQSSTLAINAGIEASRAGDAGKGFAAVAREMRTLASDSRKATVQIREILQEIRQKTLQVDTSVASGSSTVEDGVRLVNTLGDAVGQLGVTIHDAVGLMRQVEASARQQQAGVGPVTQALRSMQQASESIRDGAGLLSDLSEKAHELAGTLEATSGSYKLPPKAEGRTELTS